MATKNGTEDKKVGKQTPPAAIPTPPTPEPSELVIKEIMVQKGITREQAIEILKNPT